MTVSKLKSGFSDPVALVKLSRSGIPYALFENIISIGVFDLKEWAGFLHITERTIQRYKKNKTNFQDLHAEKIIEVAKLENRGIALFESKENFDIWMNAKSVALGGERPIDLMDTSFGIGLIEDELTRIEYGVLA